MRCHVDITTLPAGKGGPRQVLYPGGGGGRRGHTHRFPPVETKSLPKRQVPPSASLPGPTVRSSICLLGKVKAKKGATASPCTCAFCNHFQVNPFWLVFEFLQLRQSGLYSLRDLASRNSIEGGQRDREREGSNRQWDLTVGSRNTQQP